MIESIHMTDTRRDFVDALQRVYQCDTPQGYPEATERLHIPTYNLDYNWMGRLIMPKGIWDIPDDITKRNADQPPTIDEQQRFLLAGLQLDSMTRPLHPYALDVLTDPQLGAFCNRGFYRNWGPNYTVDTVLLAQDKVLLIQRKDNSTWALPGGFVDTNEPKEAAAVRELHEETGIQLQPQDLTMVCKNIPVADPRLTVNAWPQTTVFVSHLKKPIECSGGDDAKDAQWVPVNHALQKKLFAGHIPLLRAALV